MTLHTMLPALALVLVLSGCTSAQRDGEDAGESGAWPWALTQSNDNFWRSRSMGPLIEQRVNADGTSEEAVRPFYSYHIDEAQREREVLSLFPIAQYREILRGGSGMDAQVMSQRLWLLPVFGYSWFSSGDGHYDEDYFAPFPIVWGGDDSEEGQYFAVVPLAGTLKGQFGVDEISFVLGPAFVQLREGQTNKWYFPWPLLHYGVGPGYESFGLLPLYSQTEKLDSFRRYSVLWPFVSWGEEGLGSAHPKSYWTVMPFVGHIESNASDQWTFLWPFFNYGRYDTTDATIIDAPWPIFRWADGERYEEFRIWPLFAEWRKEREEGMFIGWPFFWHFIERDEHWTEERTLLLPFWYSRDRVYTREQSDASAPLVMKRRTLWPLVNTTSDVDGTWAWHFPYVLPHMGEKFERQYRTLFTLFEAWGDDRAMAWELFWGWCRYASDEHEEGFAIEPLLKAWRSKVADNPDMTRAEKVSFFCGLLGHEVSDERVTVSFLWGSAEIDNWEPVEGGNNE